MKNALLLIFTLFCVHTFAQKNDAVIAFDSLDSNIGATINIIKSSVHKIEITGDTEILKHINWSVNDSNLKIRSDSATVSYEDVTLTVYTPSLEVLNVSDGGKATMDGSFARLDNFEVTASNEAIVDLSRVEFKTLVANSKQGGQILYNDPATPF